MGRSSLSCPSPPWWGREGSAGAARAPPLRGICWGRREELWPHLGAAWSGFLPCPPCWGQPCRCGDAGRQWQHAVGNLALQCWTVLLSTVTLPASPSLFLFPSLPLSSSSLLFFLLSFSVLPRLPSSFCVSRLDRSGIEAHHSQEPCPSPGTAAPRPEAAPRGGTGKAWEKPKKKAQKRQNTGIATEDDFNFFPPQLFRSLTLLGCGGSEVNNQICQSHHIDF